MDSMSKLVGKTVKKIFVEQGEGELVFETDKGLVAYGTEGDCCSQTWFADILGVDNILGAVVRSAEDIPLPGTHDDRSRDESDECYGVHLKTSKGDADIVYRNSSNGYYGGSIFEMKRDSVPSDFKEITDDWQA